MGIGVVIEKCGVSFEDAKELVVAFSQSVRVPEQSMQNWANISKCRNYRYDLWRRWHENPITPYVAFIGVNPSTADETKDDPTIRRCVNFAKSWGYGAMHMVNLYGLRSTDPKKLKTVIDSIGPDNDFWLKLVCNEAAIVVAAWGNNAEPKRAYDIRVLVPGLHYLELTKEGQPRHPLYLKKDRRPIPWTN